MTIKEFAIEKGVLESTVKGWVKKGYIPGAKDNFIPPSARQPYTEARAKTGKAIIKSILKACDNHYGIYAGIYNLSQQEFDAYIKSLLNGEYITEYIEDGVTYYNIAANGVTLLQNMSKLNIDRILQMVATLVGVIGLGMQ